MNRSAYLLLNRIDRLLTKPRIGYAWLAAGFLWLGWLASVLLGTGGLDLADEVIGADFVQFYTAGATLRTDREQDLYDFTYQFQLQKQLIGDELDKFHAFINPPLIAWLFVPFSLIPYAWSFALWGFASLAALYAGIHLLRGNAPFTTFALSITWLPVFASISFGQNGLLSFFLISLVYALWAGKKHWLAGISAGLMLYKPQLLLGIGLFWLLSAKQNWRALAGFGLAAVATAALSILLVPQASADYLRLAQTILPGLSTREGFPIWHAHTFQAFWQLLFQGQGDISKMFAVILAAIGVFYFAQLLRNKRVEPPLFFGAAVVLTFWLTPHAMTYDLALLLIPAILFWEHMPEAREELRPLYALFWLATFLTVPLTLGQLQVMNFAVQISIPMLCFASYVVFHSVRKAA